MKNFIIKNKIFIILAFAMLFLLGFSNKSNAATNTKANTNTKNTYVFVGDSRTVGMIGGATSIENYNKKIYYNGTEFGGIAKGKFESEGKILKSYAIGSGHYKMFHDWNPEFWKRIEACVNVVNTRYPGTKVIFNLGINGLSYFNNAEEYVGEIAQMAKRYTNTEFYMISVYHRSSAYLNASIDYYNKTVKSKVEKANLKNLMYEDVNSTKIDNLIKRASDDLHPVNAYPEISNAIYKAVNKNTKSTTPTKVTYYLDFDRAIVKNHYFYSTDYLKVKEGNKLGHIANSTDKPTKLEGKARVTFYTDAIYTLTTKNGTYKLYKVMINNKMGYINANFLNRRFLTFEVLTR